MREAKVLYRAAVQAAPRVVGSAAGLMACCPWTTPRPGLRSSSWFAGLVLLVGLIALQVRLIVTIHTRPRERSRPWPPAFVVPAAVRQYLLLAGQRIRQQLRRAAERTPTPCTFAVTVFSTVEFGDISAKSETARLVVTGQMLADLIVLGLRIRVILGAVGRGRQRQQGDGGGAPPAG